MDATSTQKIKDLKPGTEIIFRVNASPELHSGRVYGVSPSGKYICVDGQWYREGDAHLLEILPSSVPSKAITREQELLEILNSEPEGEEPKPGEEEQKPAGKKLTGIAAI